MALDARHRSSLYLKFVPLVGEEDANALMSEFPASEAEELVTKQFLRAELALTNGELRSEMAELRNELHGATGSIRTEMTALEHRLTLRLGGAIAASTGVLIAVLGTLITVQ
jgi:hypothetical protein